MAEIIEHIPKLRGNDAKVFLEMLERDITDEEIRDVRAWALAGSIQ
ncbi:MAG: hypothetical protein WC556_11685 [Candidatus Methanoperedens sp.]